MSEVADWGCAAGCVSRRIVKDGIKAKSVFVSAMDYLQRRCGLNKTDNDEGNRLSSTLVLGVIMNDYYDQKKFDEQDREQYRQHRRNFSKRLQKDYRQYFMDLRKLERGRPGLEDGEGKIIEYREQLNRVTLAISFSAANFGNYRELMEGSGSPIFENVLKLIYALQIADDRVGYRGDSREKRPSYYTAITRGENPDKLDKEAAKKLNSQLRDYLKSVDVGEYSAMAPLVFAVGVIGMIYPPITDAARVLRLEKWVMVGDRDKIDA